MRILLFDSRATLGGARRALADLAAGLTTRGWEVAVLLGEEGPLQEVLARQGTPVTVEPLPAWTRQDAAPTLQHAGWPTVLQLARRFRREQWRLLYTNTPAAALLGGMAMHMAGGRTYWRAYLADDVQRLPLLSRIGYRLAEQVHAATPTVLEALGMVLRRPDRVRLIPPGVDLRRQSPRPAANHPAVRPPVIGMLGSWSPRKGQEVLVRAFRQLQDAGRRARLHLAGAIGSPEEERYRSVVLSAVKAAGLGDRVSVAGAVEDLQGFLGECDLVAIPCLQESTGRIALEAAAAGRPVVASRVGGLIDLVEDGHTGLLAPPNQPRLLADAMALLLASPALRTEMGRQARIRAENRYRLEAMLDAVETALLGAAHRPEPVG